MFVISTAIAAALIAASTVSAGEVKLDKSIIPVISAALPILSLGSPASVPDDILRQFINASSPNAQLVVQKASGDKAAYDGERLVASVSAKTGETTVYADLPNLQPAPQAINTSLAQSYLSLKQSFPKDSTNVTLVPGANLVSSRSFNNSRTEAAQVYLTHAIVQRTITVEKQTVPICGPGTRASFGFGHDGRVRSLSYQWKPATLTGQSIKSNTTDEVYQNILNALQPLAQSSKGTLLVDKVDVCIYDSGQKFQQPVFRITGIFDSDVDSKASTTRLVGYLPFGAGSPEGLPGLNESPSDGPGFAKNSTSPTVSSRSVLPQVKVGRYVVRDDTSQWVTNANDFWNNIAPSSSATFLNSQYYWAEPRLFLNEKDSFVNTVHIADTEVHGNYHLFSTESNCCDLVYLDNVPSTGYGGVSGGSLSYWILHSCEVIPTLVDYPSGSSASWNTWWNIFHGMKAAVGYRTDMYIADHVMPRFGHAIAQGAPFVSSWLQTVHDDEIYKSGGHDILYYDYNQGKNQPMGRAAAVVVCGYENDLAWQVQNVGNPSCLRQYWYDN